MRQLDERMQAEFSREKLSIQESHSLQLVSKCIYLYLV